MPLANLVLQDTVERLYAGNLYADMPRGVYLVRGENVLLLGEIVRFLSCRDCGDPVHEHIRIILYT